MDYQDSDAKFNIHHFCIEWSSSTKKALLAPLMEEFKLVDVEKYEFEDID